MTSSGSRLPFLYSIAQQLRLHYAVHIVTVPVNVTAYLRCCQTEDQSAEMIDVLDFTRFPVTGVGRWYRQLTFVPCSIAISKVHGQWWLRL